MRLFSLMYVVPMEYDLQTLCSNRPHFIFLWNRRFLSLLAEVSRPKFSIIMKNHRLP